MSDVMAFGTRRSNDELIRDCAQLGYLRHDDITFDATYRRGIFWKLWRPLVLVTNDLDPQWDTDHHLDFRDTRLADRSFEAVVFDPPYKLNGTSTGRGASAADERYAVTEYASRDDKHALIRDGITECARLCRRTLLVKCQDQVNGGRKRWQTREFADHAEAQGFRLADMLHVQGYRKQPDRGQQHSRGDYSTLLVLERRP